MISFRISLILLPVLLFGCGSNVPKPNDDLEEVDLKNEIAFEEETVTEEETTDSFEPDIAEIIEALSEIAILDTLDLSDEPETKEDFPSDHEYQEEIDDSIAPEEILVEDIHGEFSDLTELLVELQSDDGFSPEIPDIVQEAGADEYDFSYIYTPSGTCGMAEYDWLKPDQVGDVVEWFELDQYHLSAEMIEFLLEQAGYKGIIQVKNGTRVFALRYATQDRGKVIEATALVGVPDLPIAESSVYAPSVLVLHGTTGYSDACAPSADQIIGPFGAILPASLGFISVAPDFLGMNGFGEPSEIEHPYLIGEPTAIASLDSARAAFKMLDEIDAGVLPDLRVIPFGGSQGGHAALFVQRYAPVYAPEFDIDCVIALVPPANLAGQAIFAFNSLKSASALGTAFLTAAWFWYAPDLPASDIFNANGPKDYSVYIPQKYKETCDAAEFFAGAKTPGDVFNPDFLEAVSSGNVADLDPWGCYALENSLPTTQVPYLSDAMVLFVIGENDELVSNDIEEVTASVLCSQGYKIKFVECAGADHAGAPFDSLGIQFDFLNKCVAGIEPSPEEICVIAPPVQCE
ncbi:MAG: alpha/beta fold hydrolase [Deltaproteobacteria bacterium]|nr:alpha/beta fold hydrolase [Deltaproteobacteria bacterium]